MTDDIEDWAWERVVELANADGSSWSVEAIKSWSAGTAFARHIMQHEKPPVDPLLIEAREIGAAVLDENDLIGAARDVREGRGDVYDAVQGAYAALKSREARNG